MFPLLSKLVETSASTLSTFGPFREFTRIRRARLTVATLGVDSDYIPYVFSSYVSATFSSVTPRTQEEFDFLPGPKVRVIAPTDIRPYFNTVAAIVIATVYYDFDISFDHVCRFPYHYLNFHFNFQNPVVGVVNIYKD